MRKFIAGIVVSLATTTANAQSSLGITGADLRFGVLQDEAGTDQSVLESRVNVAVTEVHGVQGDIGFSDTEHGLIGQLGAHFYMTPRPGQKYGVFLGVSDVDGRSMTWGSLGVEGMLSIGDNTIVEGRIGLGVADTNSLDYIFGDMSVVHALSDNLEVTGALTLAEFDEASFRAVSYDVSLTASYSRSGQPWGVYAQVAHSGLTGREGTGGDTRLGLGVSIALGQAGGTNPRSRPFNTVDPVAPLVRRGLW